MKHPSIHFHLIPVWAQGDAGAYTKGQTVQTQDSSQVQGRATQRQTAEQTLTLKGVIQKQCFTYEAHASGEHEKSHTERTELGIERGPSH